MISRTTVLAMLCLFAAAPVIGAEETPVLIEQTMCPVMDTPIDSSVYTDYEGKRVYFCCEICRSTFLRSPEKFLAGLPQFSETAAGQSDGRHSHDHAADHAKPQGTVRLIRFAGKFHPVAVHIPIALVLAAALAEILACLTKSRLFENASRFCIVIAALGGLTAAPLGLAAAAFARFPEEFARSLFIHKWLGICTVLLLIMAAVVSEYSYRFNSAASRRGYRIVLLICVILVGVTGYFGGHLVYGVNYYSW